jgi:AraC-like DNA-binding protein
MTAKAPVLRFRSTSLHDQLFTNTLSRPEWTPKGRSLIETGLSQYQASHPLPVMDVCWQVREVLRCIHEWPFDPALNVRELMKRCRLRDHNVSSRFRRELGVPIKAYIERIRLDAAQTLLATGAVTIADAGHAVGYEYPQTFYRAIARRSGRTPSGRARREQPVPVAASEQIAKESPTVWAMTAGQRRVVEAAMRRILPSDDGAGATETNAIAYVEWFTKQERFRPMVQCFTMGVALLDSLAVATHGMSFPACDAEKQDAVLNLLRAVPHAAARKFVVMLTNLTLSGFLCAPKYGGNRGIAGWKYLEFEPHPLTVGSKIVDVSL